MIVVVVVVLIEASMGRPMHMTPSHGCMTSPHLMIAFDLPECEGNHLSKDKGVGRVCV